MNPEIAHALHSSEDEHAKKPANIETVRVNEKTYHWLHEIHGQPHTSQELESLDGLAIESAYYDYRDNDGAEWNANNSTYNSYKFNPQNLRHKNLPLFLIDIFSPGQDSGRLVGKFYRDKYKNAVDAEMAIFCYGAAAATLARAIINERTITRRDFLLASGLGLAGLLHSHEIIESIKTQNLANQTNRQLTWSEKAMEEFINNMSYERVWVVALRNAVWAQKLEFLTKRQKLDNLGMIMGAAHYGVTQSLEMSPTERSRVIENCIITSGLNRESVNIAHIAILRARGNEQIVRNPKFYEPYKRLWTVEEHLDDAELMKIQNKYWQRVNSK